MKAYVPVLLLGLLLSCEWDEPAPLRLRFDNQTGMSIRNLVFHAYQQEIFIPELPSKQTSDYHPAAVAFPRGYLKVEIEGEDYELFPVAYAQEVPLPSGDYTYCIRLADSQPHSLTMTLDNL
ncbi:MAG TPA: hypothetical protein DCR93_06295 [Cytophagales bacterium]|nr:hypothetical protein [Cytophagales bacterium]HAP59120.1 hypothetical protein [Cytophagales bacterium]